MKVAQFLILLFYVLLAAVHPLWAEGVGPAPLQLAPGSAIQQGQPALQSPGPGLAASMGEQQPLRDIHPPLPLPEERSPVMLVVGLFLLLLVLLAALFWFFRLRKKKVSLPFAHETAMAALLRARSLMTPDQVVLYAEELSDILRRYIEARFCIHSTRQTTEEFFSCLTENPGQAVALLEDHCDSLKDCLSQCDMAKFARYTPDSSCMKKMEKAVQNFIESTRENVEGGR